MTITEFRQKTAEALKEFGFEEKDTSVFVSIEGCARKCWASVIIQKHNILPDRVITSEVFANPQTAIENLVDKIILKRKNYRDSESYYKSEEIEIN